MTKVTLAVRYDLFERLNTGGVKLHPQEIRNCVMRGEFRDTIKKLATFADFRKAVRLPNNEQANAIYEECVLRFFAYLDNYKSFDHSVTDFLNEFMIVNADTGPSKRQLRLFIETFRAISSKLPSGIVRGTRTTTPLNLFEAVSVGTALALSSQQNVKLDLLKKIPNSDDLKKLTTGATNSPKMVSGRIEYVRNFLLQ